MKVIRIHKSIPLHCIVGKVEQHPVHGTVVTRHGVMYKIERISKTKQLSHALSIANELNAEQAERIAGLEAGLRLLYDHARLYMVVRENVADNTERLLANQSLNEQQSGEEG